VATGPAPKRVAELLTRCLESPLAAAGFDLEEVVVQRMGQRSVVAVTVDRDGPLDLDAIADASRIASDTLDEHDVELSASLSDAYTLEVTSRGADAPLRIARHWRRAIGRLVDVRWADGRQLVGRVAAATDDEALIESVPVPRKPGAKISKNAVTCTQIRYADVSRAVVQLEFSRVGDDPDLDEDLPHEDLPDEERVDGDDELDEMNDDADDTWEETNR
jgi:ribosome maturation factor RimP